MTTQSHWDLMTPNQRLLYVSILFRSAEEGDVIWQTTAECGGYCEWYRIRWAEIL